MVRFPVFIFDHEKLEKHKKHELQVLLDLAE
ncbi:hypothetical protein ABAC460_18335 [Asticcacaulis sp. AC460]|nr:hypothetical protein ABAC460_18335 [Asticcacaulis sp. AC460]